MLIEQSETPKVLRVIELNDHDGNMRKILIQIIEEEKWKEAVEYMCCQFITDELMCSSLNLINEPESINLFRKIWGIMVKQGLSIAAYDITDNTKDPVLIGAHMLYHENEEAVEILQFVGASSSATGKVINFIGKGYAKIDPPKLSSFGKHLEGFGICIDPKYRKLGLAQQIMDLRDELGKIYNFEYTSAIFTSRTSQRLAKTCGYELLLECPYDEAVEVDGSPKFPKLQGMSAQIMGKPIN